MRQERTALFCWVLLEKLERRNWFSEIGKEQFWGKKVRSGGTLDMLSMSCLPDPHKLRSIC